MSDSLGIGKIITTPQGRDAIHIAVVPMVAACHLGAGEKVRLTLTGLAASSDGDERTVGVVDPFLPQHVRPGERFWLFLNPQTITSLRHVWSHPLFTEEVSAVPTITGEKEEGKGTNERPVSLVEASILYMLKQQDFTEAGPLADALEEAGCVNVELLKALRDKTEPKWNLTRLLNLYLGGERENAVTRLARLAGLLSVPYSVVIAALEGSVRGHGPTPDPTWAEQDVTDDEWGQYWKDYELLYLKAPSGSQEPFFVCPCA